ncbi:hypothetical protein FACS1894201_03300 [Bacteroidia bacterium]|nr:hypothetical protein FACS1894201_03300 [Bacteroidia bacterium]
MKNIMKIIGLTAIGFCIITLIGCNKVPDPGATNVVEMCGDWRMICTNLPSTGYTRDTFYMFTANTPDNASNKMILSDAWRSATTVGYGFKPRGTGTGLVPGTADSVTVRAAFAFVVEADCDVASRTFSATTTSNLFWDNSKPYYVPAVNKLTITNGKISEGAITLPSGGKGDKIEFDMLYDNIEIISAGDIPAGTTLHFVGFRRTGFLEDEAPSASNPNGAPIRRVLGL